MSEIAERHFNVQFGMVGAQRHHSSKLGPMWTVRRAAMAVARQAATNYRTAGNESLAEVCENIRDALVYPVGPLLEGLRVEYADGERTYFIAIVPEGMSWSDCATVVFQPKRDYFVRVEAAQRPSQRSLPFPEDGLRTKMPTPHRREPVNPAKQIADKMAKAARKAVEGG